MQVTEEEIQIIARLVKDLCGVVLDQTKGYLIESRLSSVAEEADCITFSELYYKVRYANDKKLQNQIIDAITTQETLFFRDNSPFEALQFKVIPDIIDTRAATSFPKCIRVWSAACSTGQEPYSIAMVFHEIIPDIHNWDIKILATDISDAAIRQASLGCYNAHEIQRGMKPELLSKYFIKKNDGYKILDEIRAMVAFQRLNLHEPFTHLGSFDIIFCRNVAIYFNDKDKRSLFNRLADVLTTDGYLFVGSSESLTEFGPRFIPQLHCHTVLYQPNKISTAIV
ncbi:MAG: protein-glutamate O-methyltransferase CheR [Sedimentisphaerales bacterium]|nr:protein-glutamate O-methyltransferase CheR [Sedimentisphaerales bacterium]